MNFNFFKILFIYLSCQNCQNEVENEKLYFKKLKIDFIMSFDQEYTLYFLKGPETLTVLTEGSNLPLPGKLPTFLGGTCHFNSQKTSLALQLYMCEARNSV